MLLTRWHPLVNDWNRAWGEYTPQAPALAVSFPPVNVWEDQNNLYVEAELPGLNHDDLNVYVEGDQLTLSGERKSCGDHGRWHRQERGFGRFQRTFTLPAVVDADKIEAQLDAGLYRERLNKTWEQFLKEYDEKILSGLAPRTRAQAMTSLKHFERLARPGKPSRAALPGRARADRITPD